MPTSGTARVPGIQTSIDADGHKVVTSVFRSDAPRVIYTDGDKYYEAKLDRLAAVPGWMMSVARYEHPEENVPAVPDTYVFAYDADGRLVA
jgi:hypothetical protein